MPYTYEFIAGTTLSVNTATVTFSSIPATFTDLELRIMAKGNDSTAAFTHMIFTVNGSSSAIYDSMHFRGDGGASPGQSSNRTYASTYGFASYIQGPGAPADSYGPSTLYFYNYANTSTFKPWRWHSANEWNTSPKYTNFGGGKIGTNSAISSIEFLSNQFSITNYMAGSQFMLYGIKRN